MSIVNSTPPQLSPLSEAAHAYARIGGPVFPCRPRGKEPLTKHGVKDATTDEALIRAWWTRWPNANVAIATGGVSGLLVVDIDSPEGAKLFKDLIAQHGGFPKTPPAVRTGKGVHVYFQLPSGTGKIKSSAGGGLDIRADGGYVIVPPGVHPSGKTYKWQAQGVERSPIAPEWLIEWARNRRSEGSKATRAAVPRPAKPNGKASTVNARFMVTAPTTWSPAEEERVRSALATIDASNRDIWLKVGMALHELTRGDPRWAEPAPRLWDDWSETKTNADNFDAEGQEKAWASFGQGYDGDPVRIGTVYQMAQEGGWIEPNIAARLASPVPISDVTPSIEPVVVGINLARYARNDVGNREIFDVMFGRDLKFVEEWGCWLVWDGTRWVPISDLAMMPLAIRCAKEIEKLAFAMPHSNEEREKWIKHALATQKLERLKSMLSLAKSYLLIEPKKLDRNKWLLGCPNGTVELRTETLREARREDLITKQTAVAYDPTAECPQFRAHLAWALGNDAETIEYFRRVAGYGTTGSAAEEILVALVGSGNNGKTSIVMALNNALGDHAGRAPADLLVNVQGEKDAATPALVALQGKRLVSVSETKEGAKLSEAQVKLITSNHDITARQLQRPPITFPVTHLTLLDTNHIPKVYGTDDGTWRRLRIIKFEVKLAKGDVRARFREEVLEPELAGILRWMVGAAADYCRYGLGKSKKVERDTAIHRAEMDTVAQFADERIERDPAATVPFKAVFEAYWNWCLGEHATALGKKRFKEELERLLEQPLVPGTGNVIIVRGIRVRLEGFGVSARAVPRVVPPAVE